MSADALIVAALAVGQAAFLRLSQYVLPEFYFASGSLFARRAEVRWKAILFRLAIPFSAGLIVPALPAHHDYRVAAVSGAVAWFLVLWPIMWSPAVMVPPVRRGVRWLYVLWGAWWAFFTLLPLSGVAVATWIHTVHTDPAAHWWETPIADEVALFIPVGLGALLLGRLAQKEVTFFTDEPDEEEERRLEEFGHEGRSRRLNFVNLAAGSFYASAYLVPLLLLGILIAIVRGRRGRSL
jgi:hypothetical protein